MWRATIEILDFIPLANADYGGGVIITDWYNDGSNENDSIKIMVQFLSNEIRADGIKIIVYNKKCLIKLTLLTAQLMFKILKLIKNSN